MGEAKRQKTARARRLADMLRDETRCIYCASPAESVEHMPPIIFFLGRERPKGMEFAACKACNEGTRGADAVAAFMARIRPYDSSDDRMIVEAAALRPAIDQRAPGVLDEIFERPDKQSLIWARTPSGLYQRSVKVLADGPLLKAHIQTFSAKLAMALYREHLGQALPLDGHIGTMHFLNAGLAQHTYAQMVSTLGGTATLRQGRKEVSAQFHYNFSSDGETIVAALAQFHEGLVVYVIAGTDRRIPELRNGTLTNWRASRPGELLDLLKPQGDPVTPAMRDVSN